MKEFLTLKCWRWKLMLALILGPLMQSFAQQTFIVQGTVSDSLSGDPLPGVSVVQAGTDNGTATGMDGRFQLTIPGEEAAIEFSFLGYSPKQLPVNSQTSPLTIRLAPDMESLDEIVVIGYGTQRKSDVTGALSSVTAEQIQALPVQNVAQALQGKVAGADIATGNFRPGEAPTIRIRGNRSITAGNDPLYVLDGIPLASGSGINDINPLDIASVEVLKDASATAIYGSRGANGVILITTKTGKAGQARVSYDGSIGFESPLVTVDMFEGGEFAELRREAYRTAGEYGTLYPDPNNDYTLFGSDPYMWESVARGYEWVDKENRVARMRPATPEEQAMYGVNEVPVYDPSGVRTTDWQDLVLRTAVYQNHQLSISGGTDKIRVLFSGGYLNQEGIELGQQYKRYTARLSLDFEVNNWLKIGATNSISVGNQDYGVSFSNSTGAYDLYRKALGQLPIAVPFSPEGEFIRLPGGDDGIRNPILDPERVINERRSTRYLGSLFAEATLAEGLRYRLNFGPDYRQYRSGSFQAANSSIRDGSTSYASYGQEQRFYYTLENLLFYDRDFGRDHSIGLTLLQSISQDRIEGSDLSASDLPYDSQLFYGLGTTYNGAADGFGSNFSKSSLMSYMARINYGLKNKYLLTLTGRYDGSSVLAPGNKWNFFPSVALAWKMQEERFLASSGTIDELKLRLSYGKIGNSSVGPYQTGGTLASSVYVFDESPAKGYAPSSLPLPLLGWEETSTVNIGVDFSLFNYRLNGSLEFYQANTSDLLLNRALPSVSGVSSVTANIGATRNTGVELTLSSVNVNSPSGFRWETDLTFTKNKEEIVELSTGKFDDIGNEWFIGYPINVYYNYGFDGIWQESDASLIEEYNANGGNFAPGEIRVKDLDGNKKIDAEDRIILGSNVPDWTGGISNRFSYKGFELSAFIYTRQGQMAEGRIAYVPNLAGRYPDPEVDYWTPSNPSNEYPRPNKGQESPEYINSRLYQDASFVKVRNITLSYTFPKAMLARISSGVKNLNLYFTALNPFLFTDYKSLDPEASGGGNNLSTKSLMLGVRLGL